MIRATSFVVITKCEWAMKFIKDGLLQWRLLEYFAWYSFDSQDQESNPLPLESTYGSGVLHSRCNQRLLLWAGKYLGLLNIQQH